MEFGSLHELLSVSTNYAIISGNYFAHTSVTQENCFRIICVIISGFIVTRNPRNWVNFLKKNPLMSSGLVQGETIYAPLTPFLAQRHFSGEGGGGVYSEAPRGRKPPPFMHPPPTPRRVFSGVGEWGRVNFGPVAWRTFRIYHTPIMCKWTRPFWGTGCRRLPKSLSSSQAASPRSAGIERARKCLQGKHVLRCSHSTHSLLFRGSAGVTREGQQQFAIQTLRVRLLCIDLRAGFRQNGFFADFYF